MKTLDIIQIDAFTDQAFNGNPCAVVFGADDLSSSQMQRIALEMNLSETAFVMASDHADLRARYFTPAEEIPLAGHPTISTIYAALASGRIKKATSNMTLSLQLEAGTISVDVTDAEKPERMITMAQLAPKFLKTLAPEEVLPIFGLEMDDLLPNAPIMVVSTGTPQLMIPLKSKESLKKALVDGAAYMQLRESAQFFSPHLFVLEGFTEQGDTFARHVGVPPDNFEDPFTGSATGGMAAYLWHNRLISKPKFVAEQGHWMGRPGIAQVEVVGPPDSIETVRVGGRAATVMFGEVKIPQE